MVDDWPESDDHETYEEWCARRPRKVAVGLVTAEFLRRRDRDAGIQALGTALQDARKQESDVLMELASLAATAVEAWAVRAGHEGEQLWTSVAAGLAATPDGADD
jgi:hypothetical protein